MQRYFVHLYTKTHICQDHDRKTLYEMYIIFFKNQFGANICHPLYRGTLFTCTQRHTFQDHDMNQQLPCSSRAVCLPFQDHLPSETLAT